MGYQKSKHVESAQKFLHQGKIQQAVAEYLIILKHEPKDQVTLMTVGDLFVRQGETFQALEYFERLAQIYLADGFLTKAIAIYKKITKLAPEEMRPVERLGDLYMQQGVMSEARPIYMQIAEMHQRANHPELAVGLLRKLLDAEPDNARVQTRLAELLVSMNQPAEAATVLRNAAEQLTRRGDHDEALKFLDKGLKLHPDDAAARALRARVLASAGKTTEAVAMLESAHDADAGAETSRLLLQLFFDAGEIDRARDLAIRVHQGSSKQYAMAEEVAAAVLDRGEHENALVILQTIHASVLEGGEHERYSELLGRVAEAMPGRFEPLVSLVDLYKHKSDSFRLPDALIHLAKAYETNGRADLALSAYNEFLERDPENEAVRRTRDRLQAQGITPPEEASYQPLVAQPTESAEAETAAAPPTFEENFDAETQLFMNQAITDVDLYSSYGLTQKAVELLEVILQRTPDYPPALERLLDLSVGLNDETRAVTLASQLEKIHSARGEQSAADRFADLRRRFERSAPPAASAPSASPQSPAAPPAVPPQHAPQPSAAPATESKAPAAPAMPAEFEIPVIEAQPEAVDLPVNGLESPVVREVDLSEEWAALNEPAPVARSIGAEPSADDAALQAFDSILNELLQEKDPEELLDAPSALTEAVAEPETEAVPTLQLPNELETSPAVEAADSSVQDLLAEYERALAEQEVPPAEPEPVTGVDSFLRSISDELDDVAPPRAPSVVPPRAQSALPKPANTITPGPLADVFGQFRADMGENGEQQDPETHYNLGTAYREMGLREEAISEFQKAASAYAQGEPFRYAMQCYTLLALLFTEKSQPAIAVNWYERALQVPGLDPETMLALRYDLGVSQEMAGDIDAAQKSFSQVYGTNIDYRDVADRLAALARTR